MIMLATTIIDSGVGTPFHWGMKGTHVVRVAAEVVVDGKAITQDRHQFPALHFCNRPPPPSTVLAKKTCKIEFPKNIFPVMGYSRALSPKTDLNIKSISTYLNL